MRTVTVMVLALMALGSVAGCSAEGVGGAAVGALGAGAGYELAAKRQMDQLESEHKAGKIDDREYEIRKKQIQKGSLIY